MTPKQGSRELAAYMETLHRALRITSIDRQLNAGERTGFRGHLVLTPYSQTIAELSIYRPRSLPQSC
jgi:hypothetical protein